MSRKIVLATLLVQALLMSSFIGSSQEAFRRIQQNVATHSTAFANLNKATQTIGHRLTGSEQGKNAELFALELFQKAGYGQATFDPFEVNSWSREKASLLIAPNNSDNYREVETVSLAHSPVSAHVSASIIDCKDGLESDFEEVGDLKGRVALFNVSVQYSKNQGKKNLHRSEKTALAIAHGAAAVILVNSVQGDILLTGTASVTGELIDIPAICISKESGAAIRKWLRDEKDILAEIDLVNHFQPVRARNVRAVYKSTATRSSEKIIVGAHLDSWDLAQGAIDNGLGAFSVLDIARVFQELKLKTKRPIEFVLFMGEEQGLLGSKHYVKQLKESGGLNKVALMVNLDMVNNCHGFNAFGNDKLRALIDRYGAEIQRNSNGYKNLNQNIAGLHSDHQPFMLAGIPVCTPNGSLSQNMIDCYHANCDNFSLVNESEIRNNVEFVAMMLYALANTDKLPARKNSLETRDYLLSQNLKTELVLGKEWLWEE